MIDAYHKVILPTRIEFVIRLLDSYHTVFWQVGEDGGFAVVVQGQLVHMAMLIFDNGDCSNPSVGVADGLCNDDPTQVMGLDAQRIQRNL